VSIVLCKPGLQWVETYSLHACIGCVIDLGWIKRKSQIDQFTNGIRPSSVVVSGFLYDKKMAIHSNKGHAVAASAYQPS
jgi:hypothetical protein